MDRYHLLVPSAGGGVVHRNGLQIRKTAGSNPARRSKWPGRLVARTPPFQGGEAGSKPVRATKFQEGGQDGNATHC